MPAQEPFSCFVSGLWNFAPFSMLKPPDPAQRLSPGLSGASSLKPAGPLRRSKRCWEVEQRTASGSEGGTVAGNAIWQRYTRKGPILPAQAGDQVA